MKILSFNLRYTDDKNGHSIAERAPRVLDIIRDYDCDVMGFQEVTPKWMDQLAPLDERYDHLLTYRHPNNLEGTPIYWRKDRFELVESKSFWLSETPSVPSKAAWSDGMGLPRVCCYVALKCKKTGKIMHYFNTHFDGGSRCARESAQLIVRRAEALGADVPVFCTADFNFTPGSAGWHSMRSWFSDVRETIAPDNNQATLNCYQPQGDRPDWIIDFCFYHGKGVRPVGYEVITREYDGKFPSDHYGMYYEFEVE